jgi:hypothetical protein
MNRLATLQKLAIDSAKQLDWEEAKNRNLEILTEFPDHIPTLNRLAFTYLQLSDKKSALETYKRVLELEKLNPVAKKYLDLLKKNVSIEKQKHNVFEDFVEEPTKTKSVALDRLAGGSVMNRLSISMPCVLKPKGRFVSVLTQEGETIGSLPEDISFHLSHLIKTGNQYLCLVRSFSKQEVVVFLKEKFVSEENRFTPSFLAHRSNGIETMEDDLSLSEIVDPDAALEGDNILGGEPVPAEEEGAEEPLPADMADKYDAVEA